MDWLQSVNVVHMIPKKRDARLLLDDIRSVHNVGSIFRTAEAIGVARIYCAGTTPAPLDRFGRKRADFAKVSLGAEDMVPWERAKIATALIRRLKKEGFEIVALEQTDASVDYKKIKRRRKMLIILGNETKGVSKATLDWADHVAEIPMRGNKESLNVSVAAGIFLFQLMDG